MTRVILLDIDGVLVHPGGYRAALRATLNHFFKLMGLAPFDIPEKTLAELEKRGISSEWDMVPLLLASFWNEILSLGPPPDLPSSPAHAALKIGGQLNGHRPTGLELPSFELTAGQYPAESALKQGCFSSIPIDLRTSLLKATRDVHASETMRLFQHHTLGGSRFARTYGLPMEIETGSLLLSEDRSNIDDAIRARLRQPEIYLSGFSARPSAPPREVQDAGLGYAPEAELAMELVGLPDIPLIAFGKLQYLASQRGLDPVTFLKPAPVQALAAVCAAFSGDEWSSLQVACDWLQGGRQAAGFKDLPHSFELVVVEDTLGGIRSVKAAGEILRQAGFDVTVETLGLTCGSAPKMEAFRQAGIRYFDTWEALIRAAGL